MAGHHVSKMLTCLACGQADWDVAMRVLEVPLEEQRVVDVTIVVEENSRGVQAFGTRQVRERYVAEPRCKNVKACAERLAEAEREWAARHAPPSTTSDDLAWLG